TVLADHVPDQPAAGLVPGTTRCPAHPGGGGSDAGRDRVGGFPCRGPRPGRPGNLDHTRPVRLLPGAGTAEVGGHTDDDIPTAPLCSGVAGGVSRCAPMTDTPGHILHIPLGVCFVVAQPETGTPTHKESSMLLERIYDEDLAQAGYFIGCQARNEAMVVDARRDIREFLDLAAHHGMTITAITETHIHADYLSGTRELADATGATIYVSGEGGDDW